MPSNSVLPVVSGTAEIGETLSTTTGAWTGSPTYAYQWFRANPTFSSEALVTSGGDIVYTGEADISGATSSTYALVAADNNKVIGCRVTATNGAGNDDAESFVVGPVMRDEANTLFARFSASPTDERKTICNALINTLVVGDVWDDLSGLYLMKAKTEQVAKLNWVAANSLTEQGTVSFTEDTSMTGNATDGELRTGITADSAWSADSATLGVWLTSVTDYKPSAGTLDAGGLTSLLASYAGKFQAKINGASLSDFGSTGTGFFAMTRVGSGEISLYLGASKSDFSTNASGTGSGEITFMRDQYNGFTADPFVAGFVGIGLNETKMGVLRGAISTYLDAV